MPDGQVLEFSGVTKRFGAVAAVSDFSARVEPGVVTGFLGPNGAGKTTTLRILLGLVRATEGRATVGGVAYAKLTHPLQTVGAVLEASSFHPGRSAANHLAVYAQAARLPASRVDEALATVGLAEVAGRKVGGFSLGMRQRLGLAYALLGDPGVLVLDEPANGLDPEGIKWMRGLLRQLARQGRTVLVSSHLLTEVQQTADALLIISQGRLVFQGGLNDLTDPSEYATVVDSPDRAALADALSEGGAQFEVLRSGLTVRGMDPAAVGALAAQSGVALSALQRRGPALEEVFLDLVSGARVHASAGEESAPAEAAAADVVEDAVAAPVLETLDAPAEADTRSTAEAPAEADSPSENAAQAAADEAEAVDPAHASSELVVTTGADAAAAATAAEEATAPAEDLAADPEPSHEHAGFAVASTGVIEVIPDEEPETQVWAMPAAEHATEQPAAAAEPELEPDAAPSPGSTDEDGPLAGPRTEADIEADRFFSSFDDGDGEAPGTPAPEETAAETAAPEPAPEASDPEPGPKLWTWDSADEPDADDAPEGGEPR